MTAAVRSEIAAQRLHVAPGQLPETGIRGQSPDHLFRPEAAMAPVERPWNAPRRSGSHSGRGRPDDPSICAPSDRQLGGLGAGIGDEGGVGKRCRSSRSASRSCCGIDSRFETCQICPPARSAPRPDRDWRPSAFTAMPAPRSRYRVPSAVMAQLPSPLPKGEVGARL